MSQKDRHLEPQITLRLPAELLERLDLAVDERSLGRRAIIKKALEDLFDRWQMDAEATDGV
jgi:predicted transcriptional regulator